MSQLLSPHCSIRARATSGVSGSSACSSTGARDSIAAANSMSWSTSIVSPSQSSSTSGVATVFQVAVERSVRSRGAYS